MTRGRFNFQITQERLEPINFSRPSSVKVVILRQGLVSKIMLEEEKIDELIETLKACKRWLNSP